MHEEPTIKQVLEELEKEGIIESSVKNGERVYRLTQLGHLDALIHGSRAPIRWH